MNENTSRAVARIGDTELRAVRSPDAVEERPLISHPPTVVILAYRRATFRLVLGWRARVGALGEQVLAAPVGVVEPGTTLEEVAHRTLLSQVGIGANLLTIMAEGLIDPTLTDERSTLFLAQSADDRPVRGSATARVFMPAGQLMRSLTEVHDLRTWILLLALIRHTPLTRDPLQPLMVPDASNVTVLANEPAGMVGDVALHRVHSRSVSGGTLPTGGVALAPDIVYLVLTRRDRTTTRVVVLPGHPIGGGREIAGLPSGTMAPGERLRAVVERIAQRTLGRSVTPILTSRRLLVSPDSTTRAALFVRVLDTSDAPLPSHVALIDCQREPTRWSGTALDLAAQAALLWTHLLHTSD